MIYIYLSLDGPCCQWCSPLHIENIYIVCWGGLRPRTNWPIYPPTPTLAPGAPRRRPLPTGQFLPLPADPPPPRAPNHAHRQAPGDLAGTRTPRDDAPGPCASCLGLGRPPRAPPLQPPTPSAGAANSPARANWHPMPPSPSPLCGAQSPAGGPLTPGLRD